MPDDFSWWRAKASCAEAPLDLIDAAYAKPGGLQADILKARYCATCPVAAECLREAMANGEHGIWGMTGPKWRTQHGGVQACKVSGRRDLAVA